MARVRKKLHAAVTTGTSRSSGLPCAMALRLIRALRGDRRSCPRRSQDSIEFSDLGLSTGKPGPPDFAVRIVLFVGAKESRCNPIRPPHPALNVRDARETPLIRGGTVR